MGARIGVSSDPSSLDPFVMTPGSYLNVPVGMGAIGSDFSGCFWFSVHSKDTGLVSEYDFAIQMQPSLSESDESPYRNKNNNPVCVSENGIGAFFISTQSGEIPTFFAGLIASYDSSEGDYTLYANFVDNSSGVSSSVAIVDVTIQNSLQEQSTQVVSRRSFGLNPMVGAK